MWSGVVVSALASINEVNQCRARLVLRWVTVSGFNSRCGTLSRYVTSHPGQLSLVIPSWVGAMNTSQRAVTPCGWGVKQVWFVCGWQAKLCNSLVTHGPYLSALKIKSLDNKALYKFSCLCYLLYLLLYLSRFFLLFSNTLFRGHRAELNRTLPRVRM